MRRHLWWVLCLAGLGIIVAAVFIPPVHTWPAWGQPFVERWREFADLRGWGGDPRGVSALAVMLAGASVVATGLVASRRGTWPHGGPR